MARQSYNLDGVKFAVESTWGSAGGTFTVDLGWVQEMTINLADDVLQARYIKGGTDGMLADANIDLLHTVNGTITTWAVDWIQTQYLFGDYSTDSGNYTINPSRTISGLTAKGSYDATDALQIVGLTLTKCSMKLSEGEAVEIVYDYIGKKENELTETVEGTAPSENPMTFLNGSMAVDGNNYKISTATLDADFQTVGRRNVEAISSGDERVITEVIKKNLNLTFQITADLEDIDTEYEVYTDGTAVQEARSDFSIVLTMKSADGDTHTVTLTGARGTTFEKALNISGDVKTFSFNGVAKDIQLFGVV